MSLANRSAVSLLLASAFLCSLQACGPEKRSTGSIRREDQPVSPDAMTSSQYAQAAANTQAMFDQIRSSQTANPQPTGTATPSQQRSANTRSTHTPPASTRDLQGPSSGPHQVDSAAAFSPPSPKPQPTRVETVVVDKPMNRADLAFRLADRIRSEPGWTTERQFVAMLGLELIEPGVGSIHADDLAPRLGPDRAKTLGSLRDMLGQIGADHNLAANPNALISLLSTTSTQLAPPRKQDGLALGTVAMCRRVESFGRYWPYESNRFIAGRPIQMIVYSEIKNFTQRDDAPAGASADAPASASRFQINLSQELALYLDSDGSKQWHQSEQSVLDSARSRRTDYYLVQRVDLPPTLSVGMYNLKVIVRDKLSGAEVERAVPIEIVADPKLAHDKANLRME